MVNDEVDSHADLRSVAVCWSFWIFLLSFASLIPCMAKNAAWHNLMCWPSTEIEYSKFPRFLACFTLFRLRAISLTCKHPRRYTFCSVVVLKSTYWNKIFCWRWTLTLSLHLHQQSGTGLCQMLDLLTFSLLILHFHVFGKRLLFFPTNFLEASGVSCTKSMLACDVDACGWVELSTSFH